MPPETYQELQAEVDEQAKAIKNLKDDVNRKRELINSLKSDIKEAEKEKEKESLVKSKSGGDKNVDDLQEKIKGLNKDINRKDLMIKDLKTNFENIKSGDKKQQDEIASLTEKLKIAKIDIGRKDVIIKDYKEKDKEKDKDDKDGKGDDVEKLKERVKK